MSVLGCLAAMALLVVFTAWVVHEDGKGKGREEAYADMERRRRAERRNRGQ